MIVAGIDIGSRSAKAVIMSDDKVMSSAVTLTGIDSTRTAQEVLKLALVGCGLSAQAVQYTVSTGYGRVNVPFAQRNISEISCHAKGSWWTCPCVRTVLDIGGQDCKAIRCDEMGKVLNFVMNDKCAAGTGRYLERTARVLQLLVEAIGARSLQPVKGGLTIDSYCTVFAGDDVLSFLRAGEHVNDILVAVADALTKRLLSLLERIGVVEAFSVTGGVAKNVGITSRLGAALGLKVHIAPEPQLVGAVGAALFARDILNGRT